jgi:putative redox protein
MVEIQIRYEGQLHCEAVHGPSRSVLVTDAPTDNMGKGEAFSPTDLVATALGTCMLTVMGIVGQRHGIELAGTTARVTKEMAALPTRRIGRIGVEISVPQSVALEDRRRYEHAVHMCPVGKSLHPDVEVVVTFRWAE